LSTWKLSTASKKNAVEKQYWTKEGVTVVKEEGYRWGTFYCESDERPDIDLSNEDGYDLSNSEYDWELDSLDDGCWVEWDFPEDMDEEEQERIQSLWDEDFFEGLEGDGWVNDDTEYWFYGPLELEEIDE
jgi:hypothetical protein